MVLVRRAMVLAAGIGSRLGSLTATQPKCLVDVAGRPMLAHVIGRLAAVGVSEVMVNVHHLADQVRAFVESAPDLGARISLSYEPEILGTGGGLKKAAEFFKDESVFIMHNADVFAEFPLDKLAETVIERDAVAALATLSRDTSRALLFDGDGAMIGWEGNKREVAGELERGVQAPTRAVVREVPEPRRYSFTGIQALSPRIFHHMANEGGAFSIIRTYMNAARAGERVHACPMDGHYWIDMGSPENLERLRAHVAQQSQF